MDGHGIEVTLGLDHKDKVIICLVNVGDRVLKSGVRGWVQWGLRRCGGAGSWSFNLSGFGDLLRGWGGSRLS